MTKLICLQTPEEFMQSFFAERYALRCASVIKSAPFRERFFTEEYSAKRNKEYDETIVFEKMVSGFILAVEAQADSVIVKTLEPAGANTERRIYHLVASNTGWKIAKRGRECFYCEGKGGVCTHCKRTGWRYSL